MRARGRAGRGAVGPGGSPPGCQCGRGAAAAPPGTARPQRPGPGGGVRAEPGTGIITLIISVYPSRSRCSRSPGLAVRAGVTRGAGGWAGAPRSCTGVPGLGMLRDGAVPDSPGCPRRLRSAAEG